MSKFLEVAEQAARAGGEKLLHWRGKFQAREKGPSDLVTEADVASQHAIRGLLLGAFPTHGFLGEEESPEDRIANAIISQLRGDFEYRWIVDPLDGTTNYVHGLSHYAVSIALEHQGQIIAGVVYDPLAQEMFSAERGQGARLNGQPIRASGCQELGQSLIAVTFAAHVTRETLEVRQFLAVLPHCQAVRRMGSAALNLAYVACGRLDAYFALTCKAWDIAAGVLLVEEAGGIATHAQGGPLDMKDPKFMAASTPRLHREIVAAIAQA